MAIGPKVSNIVPAGSDHTDPTLQEVAAQTEKNRVSINVTWVWGGGWLSQLGALGPEWGHGAVDFAGSGVVHAMKKTIGMRSDEDAEISGLDLPEMGALAYPDFLEAQGSVFTARDADAPVTAKSLREELVR